MHAVNRWPSEVMPRHKDSWEAWPDVIGRGSSIEGAAMCLPTLSLHCSPLACACAGHTHSMETVIHLFRTAMNYRHDVFSGPLKSELEGWVRASRVGGQEHALPCVCQPKLPAAV